MDPLDTIYRARDLLAEERPLDADGNPPLPGQLDVYDVMPERPLATCPECPDPGLCMAERECCA